MARARGWPREGVPRSARRCRVRRARPRVGAAEGPQPVAERAAREIVEFLVDGRTAILAGAYVQMLALFLAAFAIVSVTGWPDGVADRLARLGLVLTLTAHTAYVFLTAASAYGAGDLPAGTVRRYAWVSAVVAAAFLVGGASLARDGSFAPDGGYGFILFWLLPLWVAVTAWSPSTRPCNRPQG